ncbi:MAG: diacylglycerol kinase family lipid kinase [Gammaproteobacteria bacterium]|nr:diacylglycerol kinase family lipid kinase [Gammaproteobacteria bacterium]
MAIPLFINPTAGRGRAGKSTASLRLLLDANEIDYNLIESSFSGDIEEQVAATTSNGVREIIVAGGDGSIHEAVNGVMRGGGTAALGVIPMGTGNDFVKSCSIPLHWEDATTLLADRIRSGAPIRSVDIGRMNERFFSNGAGIGFDAQVTRIAQNMRWPIGDLVYLLAVFRGMWAGIGTPELQIACLGETYEGSVTLVNVSNGEWVGGMFNIAPGARNDDGELNLVYADAVSRRRVLSLLPKLLRGTHLREPEITHRQIKRCTIIAAAPVPSHLDGEIQPLQTCFDFEIVENGLRLL